MADHSSETPKRPTPDEMAEVMNTVIRSTVSAAGEPDPDTVPHLIRQRLKDQAMGEGDIDAYVAEVMAKMRRA